MKFTPEHEALRQTWKTLIDREINPNVDEWEKEGAFPAHALFKKMGDAGLLGVDKPVEYGGSGLDFSYAMICSESLGLVNGGSIPMATGVQISMATPALARYGSDELRREFLAPSISGDYVACLGVSETGAGSDVASIKTTARRVGGDWVINGGKMWTTNGAQADWMCLLANTGDGQAHKNKSLIVVPMATKGEQAHPVGLRAVGGPHLAAVDHPVAADAAGRGLDRGDIGACAGLRDAQAGDVIAADRGRQELPAQLVAAVAGQCRRRHGDLHAGCHGDRAPVHQAQRFRADHGVGEVEPRAAVLDGLVDAQEAGIAHLLEQRVSGEGAFLLPFVDVGIDLAIDQRLPGLAQGLVLGREFHRLHPCDAECDGIERPHDRFAGDRQGEGENAPRVARIDDAVVPQVRCAVERRRFAVELVDDALVHLVDLLARWLLAFAQKLLLGHGLHHAGRLLAAHDGGAVVGPGEDEARVVGAAAHAVVAGTEAAADHDGDLRHRGVGHRLDHLGAVLDDAAALGLGADHVARGVLQVDDGRALLAAELNELRGLDRALGGDRPVVADEGHRLALDLGPAADRLLVVEALELEEVRAVDQAG